MMERFNPFAKTTSSASEDLDPFSIGLNRSSETSLGSGSTIGANAAAPAPATTSPAVSSRQSAQAASRTDSLGSDRRYHAGPNTTQTPSTPTSISSSSRYTTSFPDPFGEHQQIETTDHQRDDRREEDPSSPRMPLQFRDHHSTSSSGGGGARSSSVTFAHSIDDSNSSPLHHHPHRHHNQPHRPGRGQVGGGLSSFLSRASSVTSSSVTDRVNEAVGSVRSAVDSISSQIQQAVPSNINERLSTTATSLLGSDSGAGATAAAIGNDQEQDQQQQSAASYLASKFSSATNQFSSSSANQSSSSLPTISRQRVVLILDTVGNIDWAQQFINYRRQSAGLAPTTGSGGGQSALSNFFSSATAQLTSSVGASSPSYPGEGVDLVEQADFRDISVLANQSSSMAIVMVNPTSSSSSSAALRTNVSSSLASSLSNIGASVSGGGGGGGGGRQTLSQTSVRNLAAMAGGAKIIRPEYVVIRQRSKGDLVASEHLRGIVTAFNYCLVPMFEPFEIWNTFQDKQLIFSRLLRVQKELGKENFPLIPQVYCQTYQDLLNHINSSAVNLPCLVRTGQLGKGKMRADSTQMLRDFASIVAISNLSCTVESYLDVKCDLIVQKLGKSYKLFKRNNVQQRTEEASSIVAAMDETGSGSGKQPASRQTSLGSNVLSSLISQQQPRPTMSSNLGSAFERLTEVVNVRYKNWIDAVNREFDNKLEAFGLKILVTNQDREYIVGLTDCSMEFLGNQDNQEEDRRNFVELIVDNMNAMMPKHSLSREPSANLTPSSPASAAAAAAGGGGSNPDADRANVMRRSSSDDKASTAATSGPIIATQSSAVGTSCPLGDKKKFISQTQMNGLNSSHGHSNSISQDKMRDKTAKAYGQLSSRSQSVSVNQSDYLMDDQPMNMKSSYFTQRRGSDHSDSMTNDNSIIDDTASSMRDGSSLHIFDATGSSGGLHQRPASLGQTFLDQTSTAFSSFQKQSMSFFKRLESRAGDMSSTPPMSAKSDRGFDRTFGTAASGAIDSTGDGDGKIGGGIGAGSNSIRRNDFKSQSVDYSGGLSQVLDLRGRSTSRGGSKRETPPKPPPPPHPMQSRQSSLASYSNNHRPIPSNSTTPNSTPTHSRKTGASSEMANSYSGGIDSSGGGAGSSQNKGRVVRQNSALSAFEPFDSDLRGSVTYAGGSNEPSLDRVGTSSSLGRSNNTASAAAAASRLEANNRQLTANKSLESVVKRGNQFDSASITSGDSNSTSETTTAEDTMNNLKKTFASIFGDKCE